MPKRRPKEVLQQLVQEAGEDEIERAAKVSVAQAEKELVAAGFDVAAERAKAEAIIRELEGQTPASMKAAIAKTSPESPAGRAPRLPMPKRALRGWSIAMVATVTLLVAAVTVVAVTQILPLLRRGEIAEDKWETSAPTSKELATVLRNHAKVACKEQQWDQCRRALDNARVVDPAGEDSPEVQALRRQIDEATAPAPSRDIKDKRPDIK